MSDYRSFLVPYDFSPHSEAALYAATDLARRLEADLHLVHVLQRPFFAFGVEPYGAAPAPPPADLESLREGARQALGEVAEGIEVPGKAAPHVVEGSSPADLIRELAQKLGSDLIVMGTHGRTGLAHVFLGSVAERTLRRAPCPVLCVQAPEGADEDPSGAAGGA